MYHYLDPEEDSFLQNDKTYQRMVEQLNPFLSNLESEEDKRLMLRITSNCYHKHHNSIRTKSRSDTELMLSSILALLLEQTKEIESLEKIKNQ
jgi:hypothetical protein